jgi:hypothetical protein
MQDFAARFLDLTRALAAADRISYPLAALNDLLTDSRPEQISALPRPPLTNPYRLNYVTANSHLTVPALRRRFGRHPSSR